MWRWFQCIGLVAVLALPTVGWSDTLRLVGDPWPPFVGTSLKDGGLATAIVRAALERAHYQVTFEEAPWARALKGIEEGRYDVLVDAWYSDERARIGRFSAPSLRTGCGSSRFGAAIFPLPEGCLPYTPIPLP